MIFSSRQWPTFASRASLRPWTSNQRTVAGGTLIKSSSHRRRFLKSLPCHIPSYVQYIDICAGQSAFAAHFESQADLAKDLISWSHHSTGSIPPETSVEEDQKISFKRVCNRVSTRFSVYAAEHLLIYVQDCGSWTTEYRKGD